MGDVFPRRNLGGSADYWGRVVEDRLIAISKIKQIGDLSLSSTLRANSSSAVDLARNLADLKEQYEKTKQLADKISATGSVATYNSDFGLTTGWQTVLSGEIAGVPNRSNLGVKALAVVRIIDGGGSDPGPGPTPGSAFAWPFPTSSVTSEYGPRNGRMHQGIDFGQAEGTPIPASNDGTVIGNGYGSGTGYYVDLNHGNGIVTRSFHMVVPSDLAIGAVVSKGQMIGRVGNTGNSFGDHLHWETIVNGVHQNPRDFMAAYGDGSTASPGSGAGTVVVFGRPQARLVINGVESRAFYPHRDSRNDGTLNQLFPLQLLETTGDSISVQVQVYAEAEIASNPGNFARLTVKGVFKP